MIYLETDRLLLRDWRGDDLEPFAAMCADTDVMAYYPAVLSREEAYASAKWFQQSLDSVGFGLYAAETKVTGDFIGYVGLSRTQFDAPFTPAVEVAWRLAAAHWGRGYATEAGRACLMHGFTALGLDEIVSFTTRANARSIAVMERLGMVRDPRGDFEHPKLPVGHPLRSHVLYRIGKSAASDRHR